jgi:hypothetical protein
MKQAPAKATPRKADATTPIQFDWRRHWSKRVAPYLREELVQCSLDFGMRMLDPNWKTGDAPHSLGAIGSDRIVKGKLSWYQPLNRCHWIAFFSMALGVLNYPDLDWQFVSGDMHTVPVGFGPDGQPRVVMDILLFENFTAEQSIAHTRKVPKTLKTSARAGKTWDGIYRLHVATFVPALKARSRELRKLAAA